MSQIAITTAGEESVDVRPRPMRWLGCVLGSVAVAIAVLAASRMWWGWRADQRLAAAMGDLSREQAKLAATTRADANSPNAADLLKRASKLRAGAPASEMIELLNTARAAPRIDWQIAAFDFADPRKPSPVPLSARFAERLSDITISALEKGDEASAIRLWRGRVFMCRALDAQGDLDWSNLARQMENDTCYQITSHASELKLATPELRKEIATLIREILDDPSRRSDAARTYLAYAQSRARWRQKRGPTSLLKWWVNPAYLVEAARAIELDVQLSAELGESTRQFPARGRPERRQPGLLPVDQVIQDMPAEPAREAFLGNFFAGLREQRLAGTALAIRLYQLDHQEKLPERIEQLAPDYVASVPLDPFSTDGRAVGYRIADDPFIYTLSRQGRDVVADGSWTLKNSAYGDWASDGPVRFLRIPKSEE
ncbi:MAG: hypothetical protein ACREJC_16615 [Tepidisphaeraceae bacterium]